jgi:hypothetical protein
VAVYDSKLNRLLDQLIPCRQFVRRPRPSDLWFDGDCRASKQLTRRLERAYVATCWRASAAAESSSVSVDRDFSTAITAAKSAWYAQHTLSGRGRTSASSSINVEIYNQFFVDKVAEM